MNETSAAQAVTAGLTSGHVFWFITLAVGLGNFALHAVLNLGHKIKPRRIEDIVLHQCNFPEDTKPSAVCTFGDIVHAYDRSLVEITGYPVFKTLCTHGNH